MSKLLVPSQSLVSLSRYEISVPRSQTTTLRPAAAAALPLLLASKPCWRRAISRACLHPLNNPGSQRIFVRRASGSSSDKQTEETDISSAALPTDAGTAATAIPDMEGNGGVGLLGEKKAEEYPSGNFEMEEFGPLKKLLVKCRIFLALPWERVKRGSILSMKLKNEISDQPKSTFSLSLSLPQICDNFTKAAYDPRISGIYLQIEPLSCGWGKVEEIRRHILDFRKSGKFVVCYVSICREKEYYLACACEELYMPPSAYVNLYGLAVQSIFLGGVYEKAGIQPQVERIGKYKSAGDQLSRKSMSPENREMLTALLDNVYHNWLNTISSIKGKKQVEVEDFLNSGVYQVQRLKDEGWITNTLYDDEIISLLKERLGIQKDEKLPLVDYNKYSRVRRWTLGLTGHGDLIAVIRASGAIGRSSGLSSWFSDGIFPDQFIEMVRKVRDSEEYKAAIIRIDSPGGDALASDLMWREIRLLADKKPVVASMSDVAASGGYYMAMAAGTIVAEELTLTGSIGIVTAKLSLEKLYERIGLNKEILSRGKYAELMAAEQRPFNPDEAELFAKSAQDAYKMFRDKAAFSRSMSVDQMEEVAQGRVWTGGDAASRGLVDAIGGISRAVAIAKQKANIPQDKQVTLAEISKQNPSLLELVSDIANSVGGLDRTLREALHELESSNGVQARMDGILFERTGVSFESRHHHHLGFSPNYVGVNRMDHSFPVSSILCHILIAISKCTF